MVLVVVCLTSMQRYLLLCSSGYCSRALCVFDLRCDEKFSGRLKSKSVWKCDVLACIRRIEDIDDMYLSKTRGDFANEVKKS